MTSKVVLRFNASSFQWFTSFPLLKTFSINPFQGQYPNIAVRIIATPTNPRTHRENPEIRKAKIIKTTPMINRKIPSPLPTFLTLTKDSIFSSN
jgi:hypothetical protein